MDSFADRWNRQVKLSGRGPGASLDFVLRTLNIVATIGLGYVWLKQYPLLSSISVGVGTIEILTAATVGWLLAVFGDGVAELLDLPQIDLVVRGVGLLLLFCPAVALFLLQQYAE